MLSDFVHNVVALVTPVKPHTLNDADDADDDDEFDDEEESPDVAMSAMSLAEPAAPPPPAVAFTAAPSDDDVDAAAVSRKLFAPPSTPARDASSSSSLRFAATPNSLATPAKSRAELEARAQQLRLRFTPKPPSAAAKLLSTTTSSTATLVSAAPTFPVVRVVPPKAEAATPLKAALHSSALLASRGAPTPIFDSIANRRPVAAAAATPARGGAGESAAASAQFWSPKQLAVPQPLVERHAATRADIAEQERVMGEVRAAHKAKLLVEAVRDEMLRQRIAAHKKAIEAASARRATGARVLTADELAVVDDALSADDDEFVTEVGNCVINGRDAARFIDGGWLNDECVNAYMMHLKKCAALDADSFFKLHAFNSFFYELLSAKGRGYDYSRVRTWTRQVDLFALEKVLIPVHLGNHWCLAVLNMTARRIEYYDALCQDNDECLRRLRRYLADEHQNKKNAPLPDAEQWTEYVPHNIPQQKNSYDCGMFMLEYARYSAMRVGDAAAVPRFPFSQRDIADSRNRVLLELIEANERAPAAANGDGDDESDGVFVN